MDDTNTLLRRNLSIALPPTAPFPSPHPPRLPLLPYYDVFLSFRGEDVRGKFVDHLHSKLLDLKLNVFMDKTMPMGEVIEKSILEAIERSRISVVIFSVGYADSRWCLNELVKIMRCVKNRGQVVMPVFFHVSPHHVAKQTGVYKDAFVKHEKRVKSKRVKNWRKALVAATGISGRCFGRKESEVTLVNEVRESIQKKLKEMAAAGDLSATSTRSPKPKETVKEVSLFSYQNLETIAIIRICGLGGLERTKSAKLVYDNIVLAAKTFRSKPTRRPDQEDPELKWSRKIWDVEDGDIISAVRTNHVGGRDKKVLALVDDVEKLEALLRFATMLGWFGSGSRIVLSTVDVSKKTLKVIHLYKEGGNNCGNYSKWCLDVACFMKEMVSDGDLIMNRVHESLATGGGEIDFEVRIEKFENVGMVENGKLEVATTPDDEDVDDNIPSEERISGSLVVDGQMAAEKSSGRKQPRVMQVSILVFAVVFIVSRVGPRRGDSSVPALMLSEPDRSMNRCCEWFTLYWLIA